LLCPVNEGGIVLCITQPAKKAIREHQNPFGTFTWATSENSFSCPWHSPKGKRLGCQIKKIQAGKTPIRQIIE
jgi:hypothetical protein